MKGKKITEIPRLAQTNRFEIKRVAKRVAKINCTVLPKLVHNESQSVPHSDTVVFWFVAFSALFWSATCRVHQPPEELEASWRPEDPGLLWRLRLVQLHSGWAWCRLPCCRLATGTFFLSLKHKRRYNILKYKVIQFTGAGITLMCKQ